MISVAMLGAGAGGYYLREDAHCADRYSADHGRSPGQWLGDGTLSWGRHGPLEETGRAQFVGLLDGVAPGGNLVSRPVPRADPKGLLPAAPLIGALRVGTLDRSTQLPDAVLERVLARTEASPSTRLGARTVAEIARAAGVDPVAVYRTADGKDTFTAALHHAGKVVDARRTGIEITISAPKSISVLAGLADEQTAARIEACHLRAAEQALGFLQRRAGHRPRLRACGRAVPSR